MEASQISFRWNTIWGFSYSILQHMPMRIQVPTARLIRKKFCNQTWILRSLAWPLFHQILLCHRVLDIKPKHKGRNLHNQQTKTRKAHIRKYTHSINIYIIMQRYGDLMIWDILEAPYMTPLPLGNTSSLWSLKVLEEINISCNCVFPFPATIQRLRKGGNRE